MIIVITFRKFIMSTANVKVGQRVEVIGKDVVGKVAYIGTTQFAPGKWIGKFPFVTTSNTYYLFRDRPR